MRTLGLSMFMAAAMLLGGCAALPAPNGAGEGLTPTPSATDQGDRGLGDSTAPPDSGSTTSEGQAAPDACSILSASRMWSLARSTLGPGQRSELASHGIDGVTCFYESVENDQSSVSVTVFTGPIAAAIYERESGAEGVIVEVPRVPIRAVVFPGEIQSNVYVLESAILVEVDIIEVALSGGPSQQELVDTALQVYTSVRNCLTWGVGNHGFWTDADGTRREYVCVPISGT